MIKTQLVTTSHEVLTGKDDTPIPAIHATPASPRATAVLLPAMGVPASYYTKAAERLAQQEIATSILEVRGQGDSPVRISRGSDFGYQDLLDDVAVVATTLRGRYPNVPVVLLGHSLGGHLAMMQLALDPGLVDAVVLITTAAPHPHGYRGVARWRVWFGTRLARVLSLLLGYYPGDRVGFGGVQPKLLIREWASMGRTGNYFLEGSPVDIEAELRNASTPVLAIPIRGDILAPRAACEMIAAKLPGTCVEWADVGVPPLSTRGAHHQRWAREPEPIMDAISAFIERKCLDEAESALGSAAKSIG